jgi:hypothetical protein
MSGDGVNRVADIVSILNSEAAIPGNLVPLHPSKKLRALPGEHRPDNQLNVTLQLRKRLAFLV